MKIFNLPFNLKYDYKNDYKKREVKDTSFKYCVDFDFKIYSQAVTNVNKTFISFASQKLDVNKEGKQGAIESSKQRLSARQIEEKYGLAAYAIENTRTKWSLIRKEYELIEQNKKRIIELFESGATNAQISDEIDCKGASITKALVNRWEVQSMLDVLEQNKARIIERYKQERGYVGIAKEIGCGEIQIKDALVSWGFSLSEQKIAEASLRQVVDPLSRAAKEDILLQGTVSCDVLRNILQTINVNKRQKNIILEMQKDRIIQLFKSGATNSQISAETGFVGGDITCALVELWGVCTLVEILEQNKSRILKLYDDKKECFEIIQEIGCDRNSVGNIIEAWKKDFAKEDDADVKAVKEKKPAKAAEPAIKKQGKRATKQPSATEMHKDKIIALFDDGAENSHIAEETGCSMAEITQALVSHWKVCSLADILERNKDKIIELYGQDCEFYKIGQQIGCDGKKIKNALLGWNIIKPEQNVAEKNLEYVIRAYKEHVSLKDIGETIGCSGSLISETIAKYGITRDKVPTIEKLHGDKIVELYEQGLYEWQIGEIVGCSQSVVSTILINRGFSPKDRNMTDIYGEQIKQLREQGYLQSQIAKKLGCAQTTVSNILRELQRREELGQMARRRMRTILCVGRGATIEDTLNTASAQYGNQFFVIRGNKD